MRRYLTKRGVQVENKYMERCSISLIIREIQIKTIMRYQYTSIRIAKFIKSDSIKCCRYRATVTRILCTELYDCSRKVWEFLIKLHMHLPYDSEIPLLLRGVKWEFIFKSKPINKIYTFFIHNYRKTGDHQNVLHWVNG